MPRALRLESENACYHVINRGNYRTPIFASDGAKRAFLRCLDEAAQDPLARSCVDTVGEPYVIGGLNAAGNR